MTRWRTTTRLAAMAILLTALFAMSSRRWNIPSARADDPMRQADEAGAEALRRTITLWQSGQHEKAWFLYQDATRLLNADLRLLAPRNSRLAALRREAAEQIGAQLGGEAIRQDHFSRQAKPHDWPQWGGWSARNNVALADDGPSDWAAGEFDRRTGAWLPATSRNIKWVAQLGSLTYGGPAIAAGKIFIGTNNSAGYLDRAESDVDLGCLIAFSELDGKFLWQHSSEKLPTGRVHDWPLLGICSTPLVEGNRLWFVTSRCEVRCLDTEGFYDGEDDGRPASAEPARLFDVARPDPPLLDPLPDLADALDAGRLPEALRPRFSRAGVELPAQVAVSRLPPAAAERRWSLQARLGGASRDFVLEYTGRRLSTFQILTIDDRREADVVWVFDMMKELGVSPHNMSVCSPTAYGDVLFIGTANGIDESHLKIPAPQAPSFIALDKRTGKILWTDNSASKNVQHANWGSPAVGLFAGVPQVIFGGGDGWVYSFHADQWQDGKPILLWKFDGNAKDAVLELGGRGTRNEPIALPVIYDGLVYFTMGQDPEHGEGLGDLWCIDPTRRGDVSPRLVVCGEDRQSIVPHRREKAFDPASCEAVIDNPNSAVVWHYRERDRNGDGKLDFEEVFHRSISSVVVKNDVLFAVDFSGLAHCLHAKTGRLFWTCDLLAAAWTTPLVIGDQVYITDEDGDITMFRLHPDPLLSTKWTPSKDPPLFGSREPLYEINMGNSIYSTPAFANGVLYVAAKDHLFAIAGPQTATTGP